MNDIIIWIKGHVVELLAIWGAFSLIMDTIVGLTTTPKDNEAWSRVKSLIQNILWVKKQ